MPEEAEAGPSLAYMQALREVSGTFAGHEALALVRGAWRLGLVQAAAEPATAEELAASLERPVDRVRRVLTALTAYDVLDLDDGRFVVTERWRPLLLPDPPTDLLRVLRFREARSRMVEDAVDGLADYWTTTADDRTAYAVGVSLDPESPGTLELLARAIATDDVLTPLLERGGSYLELGCGVAGGMSTILQLYPNVRGVGVELSEELADVARERSHRLGLEDRMEIVLGDATTFSRPDSFDFAFWSQFFFPEGAREAALQVLFSSLRSGGMVRAPLLQEPVADVAELRTVDGRDYALDALLHGAWGIPDRSAEDLQSELERTGFIDVEFVELPFARVVRGRKP